VWRLSLFLLCLAFAGPGCISTASAVLYEDSATADPAIAEQVQARFAALHDQHLRPARAVKLWEGRSPRDLVLRGEHIEVPAGAPYQLIGSFRIRFMKLTSLTSKDEAREDVRRLAASAGGNFVVMVLDANSAGHATEARGFILNYLGESETVEVPASSIPPAPRGSTE
jgi:hypothetical protein